MVCERCGTVFCWDEADEGTLVGNRKRFCSKECQLHRGMPMWMAPTCRAKKRYGSEGVAGRIAELINATYQRQGRPDAVRPYPCEHGKHWHLTSEVPKSQTPERAG